MPREGRRGRRDGLRRHPAAGGPLVRPDLPAHRRDGDAGPGAGARRRHGRPSQLVAQRADRQPLRPGPRRPAHRRGQDRPHRRAALRQCRPDERQHRRRLPRRPRLIPPQGRRGLPGPGGATRAP
ncbi:hypothetical protein NOCARDAX2BIS_400197 [Nocardioides sp. AX2bis]|nr:hypothetical protein NOCARDAX2BIS_400197 [Nocardioides sp. AX2bis]